MVKTLTVVIQEHHRVEEGVASSSCNGL
jgi:hypothetical protein